MLQLSRLLGKAPTKEEGLLPLDIYDHGIFSNVSGYWQLFLWVGNIGFSDASLIGISVVKVNNGKCRQMAK